MPADSPHDRPVGVSGKTCQGSILQGQKRNNGFPRGIRTCYNDDNKVGEIKDNQAACIDRAVQILAQCTEPQHKVAGDIPLYNWDEQQKNRKKEKERNQAEQITNRQANRAIGMVSYALFLK